MVVGEEHAGSLGFGDRGDKREVGRGGREVDHLGSEAVCTLKLQVRPCVETSVLCDVEWKIDTLDWALCRGDIISVLCRRAALGGAPTLYPRKGWKQ